MPTPEPTTLSPDASPLARWTLGQVARLVEGEVEERFAGRPFGPVCTDSRALRPGEYFLALRGEKFDGHQFCTGAAAAGAAGLIVDREFAAGEAPPACPIVRVVDTLRAYGDLAAVRRREWGGPKNKMVLAIGGSAGKTTTRRLVASALARHRRVLEPLRNFNNLVGVPATLLRLGDADEVAVLELGMNQPGELLRLAEIAAPSAALLTQIGIAHIGMFTTMQDLISAKMDLFRGCAPGTPLAVNASCPRTMLALDPFVERREIILFTGEERALSEATPEVRIENARPIDPVGYAFDLVLPGRRLAGLELRLFGRHHLANVAAAAALLLAAGEKPEWIAEALPGFRTEPYRGEILEAAGHRLIIDCYNASPPSMLSALRSLAETPCAGRRVIVLADMLELGEQSVLAHEMLLAPLRALAPALFFGLGPRCRALADTLSDEGWPAEGYLKRDELTAALEAALAPDDLVFFKGSHGFGLEHVAHAIAPDAGILK